jgi:hypothetical protein
MIKMVKAVFFFYLKIKFNISSKNNELVFFS